VELVPESRLMFGHLREELISGNRRSRSTYGVLTLLKEVPRYVLRLVFMDFARRVRDNISDDLIQWTQPPFSTGALQEFADPLVAQNTFINTAYLELKYAQRLPVVTKMKLETYHQQGKEAEGERDERFFGLVNKADYRIVLSEALQVQPQWKQLLSIHTPTRASDLKTRELTELFFLLLNYRLSPSANLGTGVEYEVFANLRTTPQVLPAGFQPDFRRWTLATQYSIRSAYQGYEITSNVGFRWGRRSMSGVADSNVMAFVNVYAGLGTER
jgi:hypothetical protein